MEKTYCVKHKKLTGNRNTQFVITENGRTMMKSICDVSPHVKTRFVKSQKGGTMPGIGTGITVIQKNNRSSNAREQTSFQRFLEWKNIQESRQKFQKNVYKIKTTLQTNNQEKNTWM